MSTWVRVVAAAFAGLVALGLSACGKPAAGSPTPASTTTSRAPPSSVTVVAPPETVYVAPPETVTVPTKPLTPCQRMLAEGYSYDMAYIAWGQAGYPPNWDADHDGYPCEQSFGNQN